VTVKGVVYWRVRLGKRFTGGKVQIKHFKTLEEARQWIQGTGHKLKATPVPLLERKTNLGAAGFELTPSQNSEAVDAFRRLAKTDMTLTYAVDFALKHARPAAGVISVAEAIENARVRKQSRRPTYRANLKSRWLRFERWLPKAKKKGLHLVTQADIRSYLNHCNLKPKGEDNERRHLAVLFSWAVEQHYIAANPCKGIAAASKDEEKKPPQVLTIPEVVQILTLAQQQVVQPLLVAKDEIADITVHPWDLIPYLTIGLFAGYRPEETRRIEWHEIDFTRGVIKLPASKAKGKAKRRVTMRPNLIAWLKPCRPENGKGKIILNWRWKFRAFQKALGEGWNPWPHDSLRASYASYDLERGKHAGETAKSMGHRNVDTLYRHYIDEIEEVSDAEVYWTLDPESVAALHQEFIALPPGSKNSLRKPTVGDPPVKIHVRKAAAESPGRREFSDSEVEQIKAERKAGATYPELAKKWQCSKSTLSYMLSEKAKRRGIYGKETEPKSASTDEIGLLTRPRRGS
jgi:integrase